VAAPHDRRYARRPRRRGRGATVVLIIGLLALIAAAGVGGYLYLHPKSAISTKGDPTPSVAATGSPTPSTPPTTAPASPTAPPTWPANGPDTYAYAAGTSPVIGTAGTLHRFRVAVETGLPETIEAFDSEVQTVLSDPRSWIAGNNVRLQRVAGNASSDFTVYLVSPGTAYKYCLAGGFDIVVNGTPYTSCRVGARVLINVARYETGIPNYGAPLSVYREYAINHEVGHALGHGHELCPGKGMLAPVMQQQTLYMQGCLANAWPYVNGKRYQGPAGKL
jgi:hypothetical protein